MKRSIAWYISSIAVLMITVLVSAGQAQQPTAVLTIQGVDALLDAVDFVGAEGGQPGVKKYIELSLNLVTEGKGLAGIDRTKPFGIYWTGAVGEVPETAVAFVPVTDIKALQELLEQFKTELKEVEEGQWEASVAGVKVYGKASGGYLFISPTVQTKFPDVGKIANVKYDISLDVILANLPEPLKQSLLEQSKKTGDTLPKPRSEAERRGRQVAEASVLSILKAIVNDGDTFTLGLDVNRETRVATIDLSLTAKAESALSKVFTAYGMIQPLYASLGDEAAPFRVNFSLPTFATPEQIDDVAESVRVIVGEFIDKDARLQTDQDRDYAKRLLSRVLTMTQATFKSGAVHAGAVLQPNQEKKPQIIAVANVTEGEEAGKFLDDMLERSKSQPESFGLKLDVDKHAGARIHSVKSSDNRVQEMFGSKLGHFAIRHDSLWFASGTDNLHALKTALELKPVAKANVAPISMQINMAALQLLIKEDKESAGLDLARKVVGTPGEKLHLEIAPIISGARFRIECGLDVFKLTKQFSDKDKKRE